MTESNEDAGRVVPAYALTRGRTRSVGEDLPLETPVTATFLGLERCPTLQMEHRAIVELCIRPASVAEIAAHIGVPVGVARVIVSDLANNNLLTMHLSTAAASDERPSPAILERLLDGLRAR